MTTTKIALLGAAGGIGQPLALLLANMDITELALYDIVNTPGVAADLSHCNTGVKVTGWMGQDELEKALVGADIVVIPAGVPRKPGMTRDDLFNINAGIVQNLASNVARYCPQAIVCVISNPVNSTVPIFAEVLRKHGCFDARRLFGVTTLDSVRAATFLNQRVASIAARTRITVLGGHSGRTIVPIFSSFAHGLAQGDIEALTHRVQFGGDEVVQAKQGAGSATLSMAFAARRFVDAVLRARAGEAGVVESAYVYVGDDSTLEGSHHARHAAGCSYLAVDVALGHAGADHVLPLPTLSPYEAALLSDAAKELGSSITKGIEFVQTHKL